MTKYDDLTGDNRYYYNFTQLCKNANYKLDFNKVESELWLKASINSVTKPNSFITLFKESLSKANENIRSKGISR